MPIRWLLQMYVLDVVHKRENKTYAFTFIFWFSWCNNWKRMCSSIIIVLFVVLMLIITGMYVDWAHAITKTMINIITITTATVTTAARRIIRRRIVAFI